MLSSVHISELPLCTHVPETSSYVSWSRSSLRADVMRCHNNIYENGQVWENGMILSGERPKTTPHAMKWSEVQVNELWTKLAEPWASQDHEETQMVPSNNDPQSNMVRKIWLIRTTYSELSSSRRQAVPDCDRVCAHSRSDSSNDLAVSIFLQGNGFLHLSLMWTGEQSRSWSRISDFGFRNCHAS